MNYNVEFKDIPNKYDFEKLVTGREKYCGEFNTAKWYDTNRYTNQDILEKIEIIKIKVEYNLLLSLKSNIDIVKDKTCEKDQLVLTL